MMKKYWFITILVVFFYNLPCHAKKLNTGPWRFELKTEHADIPFIIHLGLNKKRITGKLHNGKETIRLTDITYSKNKLIIPLQTYDASLELMHESPSLLKGHYIRHNKNPKQMLPVIGVYGHSTRYSGEEKRALVNLNGRWSVTLTDGFGDNTPGIVIFEQSGNEINGSILTATGDYRYFEGYVTGTHFEAASFDGVFNYLFKGELIKNKLSANILSTTVTKLDGYLDPKAKLPDPYKQTTIPSLNFKFPDVSGKKQISLKDKKFKNRPVIVQIFGSWCPNCMDEMNFLIPWYHSNAKRGIEIVTLAFERSLSEKDARRQLIKLQRKKKIPFTLLQAGSTSEDKPADKLPGLNNFISFPTTIFLNKKHQVIKVHAGFSGPSTGEFYQKWTREFDSIVNQLLK